MNAYIPLIGFSPGYLPSLCPVSSNRQIEGNPSEVKYGKCRGGRRSSQSRGHHHPSSAIPREVPTVAG